jgi:hypothetical protein
MLRWPKLPAKYHNLVAVLSTSPPTKRGHTVTDHQNSYRGTDHQSKSADHGPHGRVAAAGAALALHLVQHQQQAKGVSTLLATCHTHRGRHVAGCSQVIAPGRCCALVPLTPKPYQLQPTNPFLETCNSWSV